MDNSLLLQTYYQTFYLSASAAVGHEWAVNFRVFTKTNPRSVFKITCTNINSSPKFNTGAATNELNAFQYVIEGSNFITNNTSFISLDNSAFSNDIVLGSKTVFPSGLSSIQYNNTPIYISDFSIDHNTEIKLKIFDMHFHPITPAGLAHNTSFSFVIEEFLYMSKHRF